MLFFVLLCFFASFERRRERAGVRESGRWGGGSKGGKEKWREKIFHLLIHFSNAFPGTGLDQSQELGTQSMWRGLKPLPAASQGVNQQKPE